MNWRRFLTTIAAVLTTALAGCGNVRDSTTNPPGEGGRGSSVVYPIGERPPGPHITGSLLDDSVFDASTLTGHVTVINFWASSCVPCRAETDDLEAVHDASRRRGVMFLGVDVRDSRDAATAFLRGRTTYPSLFDPDGKVGLQFTDRPLTVVPSTVLLDRHGAIAAVFHRGLVRSELEPLVDRLATETA